MNEAQQQVLDRARRGDSAALMKLIDGCRAGVRALLGKRDGRPPEPAAVEAALDDLREAFPHFQDAGVAEFGAWVRGRVLSKDGPTLRVRAEASPPRPTPAQADSWATVGGGNGTAAPAVRERIGRYEVLDILGAGGMGVVYKAQDPQLNRTVAIKVPRCDTADQSSRTGRERFQREARAAAAIRHPRVCPIHDVGEQDGVPYVVMAYVEGQSLAARLAESPIERRHAVRLAREIAEALEAVHEKGLVHRDLKPGNILLDRAGHAVLTDFGLSRFAHAPDHVTDEGTVVGTPAYMAPEQARGENTDARSDLFSLGTVLYELFTGQLPFKGRTTTAVLTALAVDEPVAPTKLSPDLPPELAELLVQLLRKEPRHRPRSARAVVERLQAIERQVASRKKGSRPRTPKADAPTQKMEKAAPPAGWWKRYGARLTAGVLCLIAVTVAGVWWCGPPARSKTGSQGPAAGPAAKPATRPRVKIILLAGQTDMAGRGAVSTLDWLGECPTHGWLLAKFKEKDGSWKVRANVRVYYPREKGLPRQGPLTVGYGESDREIGPELGLGHTLGEGYEGTILLVKVTHGPMRMDVEARPPSSGGEAGPFYKRMIDTMKAVLADVGAHVPDYEGQGHEVAGFVWMQGWNDHLRPELRARYEAHLVNLIKDVRKDLGVPRLPVVVGELGVGGKAPHPHIKELRQAQAAAVRRPELGGNVALMETSAHWDETAEALLRQGFDLGKNQWHDPVAKKAFDKMGSQPGYLYLGSGKVFARIGHGLAESLKGLWAKAGS